MSFGRRVQRHRERLAQLDGTPVVGALWRDCVAVCIEGAEPLRVDRRALGYLVLFAAGGALPDDTIDEIDRELAAGHVPVLSIVDGFAEVQRGRLIPLAGGGDA